MQTKTVQVVMLPQSKDVWHKNDIVKLTSELWHKPIGTLAIAGQDNLEGNTSFAQPQHLYFTSNDEIREGDWYIDDCNEVRNSIISDKDYWNVRKSYRKIEATTNTSLNLPGIPEQWIRDVYVPRATEIKEVQLEVELECSAIKDNSIDKPCSCYNGGECDKVLKLSDNNEVCIMIGNYTSTNTMAECEKVAKKMVAENEQKVPVGGMANELRKHLSSISDEQFQKEWQEIVVMGLEGPTVSAFLKKQKEFTTDQELEDACEDFLPHDPMNDVPNMTINKGLFVDNIHIAFKAGAEWAINKYNLKT